MGRLAFIFNTNNLILLSAIFGVIIGLQEIPSIESFARETSNVFMGLLKLISLPVIFLAIVATVGGMSNSESLKKIGRKTLFYTLLTTLLSAAVALIIYLIVDPAASMRMANLSVDGASLPKQKGSYWSFLLASVPHNIVQPFLEHNVMGVLFLSVIISFAMLALPEKEKQTTVKLVRELFQITLQLARYILTLIPLAVAAFVIKLDNRFLFE